MPDRPGSDDRRMADSPRQFDRDTARLILQRAAEEHRRLTGGESFSLQELEEIAAEAHISPEALHKAIDAVGRDPAAFALDANEKTLRSSGALAAARCFLRGRSPRFRRTLVAAACGIVLVTLMVAFPAVAEAVSVAMLLALLVFAVLLLVGASPF